MEDHNDDLRWEQIKPSMRVDHLFGIEHPSIRAENPLEQIPCVSNDHEQVRDRCLRSVELQRLPEPDGLERVISQHERNKRLEYLTFIVFSICFVLGIVAFAWWSWTSWKWGLLLLAAFLILCYRAGKQQ